MIVSFQHKGLEKLFMFNKAQGVKQDHVKRLKYRLSVLNQLKIIEDLASFPGFKLHKLSGGLSDHFAIWVSGNWRLIFRWDEKEKNVEVLDYLDYH
jgi:toxin HigB-1